jgi:hypothetical protein
MPFSSHHGVGRSSLCFAPAYSNAFHLQLVSRSHRFVQIVEVVAVAVFAFETAGCMLSRSFSVAHSELVSFECPEV